MFRSALCISSALAVGPVAQVVAETLVPPTSEFGRLVEYGVVGLVVIAVLVPTIKFFMAAQNKLIESLAQSTGSLQRAVDTFRDRDAASRARDEMIVDTLDKMNIVMDETLSTLNNKGSWQIVMQNGEKGRITPD